MPPSETEWPARVDRIVADLARPDPLVLEEAGRVTPDWAEHTRLANQVQSLQAIEVRQPVQAAPAERPFRIAAWNLERCKYATETASLLGQCAADIVLLSEMDLGMARSGNRHTTADLADALGFGYAFGVEFVELGLGDDREMTWHAGESNTGALHGNAILSRTALTNVRLVRLDAGGVWFNTSQRRLGSRMALLADVSVGHEVVTVASVHLESNSDAQERSRQIRTLLAHIPATQTHIVIGGDLNTKALPSSSDVPEADEIVLDAPELYEPLFCDMAEAGFDWRSCNTGDVSQRTRPDGTPRPPFRRIDWLFVRGLNAENARTEPAVDTNGSPISDHDLISADFI